MGSHAGLLCLVLLSLSACTALASERSNEEEWCPPSCSCYLSGMFQRTAVCSGFNATLKFDNSITKLVIENASKLILDNYVLSLIAPEVQSITIRSSTFQKIGPKAFANLENLSYLQLEGNNRMVLHPDMFNSTSLLTLSIRQSKITFSESKKYLFDIRTLNEIELINADVAQYLNSESFSKMPLLESINLSSNMIKHVELMFNNLQGLESVDLSDNLINELHPDTFPNPILDVLVLHKNPLTSIKGLKAKRVTELNLSLCKFNKIDGGMFATLPRITHLNMSGNAISEIDVDTFSDLEDLFSLDLSNNALKSPLDSDIFAFNSAIQVINFAHNPSLKTLPAGIFEGLTSLFRVDLSYCGLTNLEEEQFKGLDSLTTLNLAGNNLQELKPSMLDMHIIHLDLSHNNITDVNKIQFVNESNIQTLKLANNKLGEVSTYNFKNLKYLKQLDLTSCGLRSLWSDEPHPPVLKTVTNLLLAKNNIEELFPRRLDLTPYLRWIDISENSFVCDGVFQASLEWLRVKEVEALHESAQDLPKEVMPGHPYGNDGLYADKMDTLNAEKIGPSSLDVLRMQVCGFDRKEPLDRIRQEENAFDEKDLDDDEEEEGADEGDSEDEDADNLELKDAEVDIRYMTVEDRRIEMDYNIWPVIIISILGVVILLLLSVLSCLVLRWRRQKNSYGAAMLRHHLSTPRMRRDRSSIYQQLHEEISSPTTPVMSIKLGGSGTKPSGYITCASDDSPYSKNGPQSV